MDSLANKIQLRLNSYGFAIYNVHVPIIQEVIDEQPDDKDKEIERLRGLIASMLYRVWKGLESSLSYDEFVTDFKEKHNL